MGKLERWGPLLITAISLIAVLAYMSSDSYRHGRSEKAIYELERFRSDAEVRQQTTQAYIARLTNEMTKAGITVPPPPSKEEKPDGRGGL